MMSKTTRTRRTPEQWRQLIAEQAESGLSQEAFCKKRRLALSTFANWKRRLASNSTPEDGRAPDPSTWIDLGSLGAGSSGWDIELDLGGGVCLRLRRS
jgi:putative transposase